MSLHGRERNSSFFFSSYHHINIWIWGVYNIQSIATRQEIAYHGVASPPFLDTSITFWLHSIDTQFCRPYGPNDQVPTRLHGNRNEGADQAKSETCGWDVSGLGLEGWWEEGPGAVVSESSTNHNLAGGMKLCGLLQELQASLEQGSGCLRPVWSHGSALLFTPVFGKVLWFI